MKRALTLIPIVGILTTGILVCVPKSASAYCIYNKAAFPVHGVDTRKGDQLIPDKYWEKDIPKDGKDCCPGNNKECQGARIKVTGDQNSSCEAPVDAHGSISVFSISENGKTRLECRVQ